MTEKTKGNLFLYKSAVVASLAGFLFGFDTVVISGAEQAIQQIWSLNGTMHGIAISMALWGTVIGALLGGLPTERLGRRSTLLWIGLLYIVSAIGAAFASNVYFFMFSRFIGGVGIGVSTIAAPLFIAEIAPPKYRGRLAGMFQFNIVFGILVAYLSNSLLESVGENSWRWMLGVEALPALIYAVFSFGLPESPRWLIIHKKDRDGGLNVFRRVNSNATPEELEKLVNEVESTSESNEKTSGFFNRKLLKPILLAVFIAFFNQLSGINAILYFAPRIFEMTGLESQAALLQSVGIGITNLIFTFVGLWLIDRLGRRTLLYIGSFGYILSLGLCSWAFSQELYAIVPACIFSFIAAHAIGQGAVIWVFISEIFPNRYRAAGQTLGSFTHWFFAASLTLVFPVMAEALSPSLIFGIFCGMMVLQLAWVRLMVPETKGKSLEQIEKEYDLNA
ncbi:MAG: sugar porter family MFS transporter [Bacteroidales bacterium]|nr:sugar porter family MFS transporter [Bacteroidales bacterium]